MIEILNFVGPEEPMQQIWLGVNAAFSIANLIIIITVVWKLSSKLTSLEDARQATFLSLQELKGQVLELIKAVAFLESTRRNR